MKRIFIVDDDLALIKYQFVSYGVINSSDTGKWLLTKKGEKLLAQLMCVKTKKR